jgi:hypothetical protein
VSGCSDFVTIIAAFTFCGIIFCFAQVCERLSFQNISGPRTEELGIDGPNSNFCPTGCVLLLALRSSQLADFQLACSVHFASLLQLTDLPLMALRSSLNTYSVRCSVAASLLQTLPSICNDLPVLALYSSVAPRFSLALRCSMCVLAVIGFGPVVACVHSAQQVASSILSKW